MRIGFACDGECTGGDWHGSGGFVEIDDSSSIQHLIMLFSMVGIISMIIYIFGDYSKKIVRKIKNKIITTSSSIIISNDDNKSKMLP